MKKKLLNLIVDLLIQNNKMLRKLTDDKFGDNSSEKLVGPRPDDRR